MNPPRGIVQPAIVGGLTGLALAAFGAVGRWLDRQTRLDDEVIVVRGCGNHPDNECFPRCIR